MQADPPQRVTIDLTALPDAPPSALPMGTRASAGPRAADGTIAVPLYADPTRVKRERVKREPTTATLTAADRERVLRSFRDPGNARRTRIEGREPAPETAAAADWDALCVDPDAAPHKDSARYDVDRLVGPAADALGQRLDRLPMTDDDAFDAPAATGSRAWGADRVPAANVALQSPQQFSSNQKNLRAAFRRQLDELEQSKFIATHASTLDARAATASHAPAELNGDDGTLPLEGGLRSLVQSYTAIANEAVTNLQSDVLGEVPRHAAVPQPPVLTRALLAPYLRAPVGDEQPCANGKQCVSYALCRWYLAEHPEDSANYVPEGHAESARRAHGGPRRRPRAPFACRAFRTPEQESALAEARARDGAAQVPPEPCLLCNRLVTSLLAVRLTMGVERNPIAHVVQNHGVIGNQEGEYRAEHFLASGETMNGLIEPFLPFVRSHYVRTSYSIAEHGEVDGWREIADLIYRSRALANPGGTETAGDSDQEARGGGLLDPRHAHRVPDAHLVGTHRTDAAAQRDYDDYAQYYADDDSEAGEVAADDDDDDDDAMETDETDRGANVYGLDGVTYEGWERLSPSPIEYSGWVEMPTTRTLVHAYVPATLSESLWVQRLPLDGLWGVDVTGLALAPALAGRLHWKPIIKSEDERQNGAAGRWRYGTSDASPAAQAAASVTDAHWRLACYGHEAPPWYAALALRLNVLYEIEAQLMNVLYMQSTDQDRLHEEESAALKSEDPDRIEAALGSTSDLAAAMASIKGARVGDPPGSDATSASVGTVPASRSSSARARHGLSAATAAASVAAGGSRLATTLAGVPPAEGAAHVSAARAAELGVPRSSLRRASVATRTYDAAQAVAAHAKSQNQLEGRRFGQLARSQAQARVTYTLRLVQRLLESYTPVAAALHRATRGGTTFRSQADLEADAAVAHAWHRWHAPYVYHPRDAPHARWVLWELPPRVPSALSVLLDGCGAAAYGLHEGFDWLVHAFRRLDHARHATLRAWVATTTARWDADPVLPDVPGPLPPPATHAVLWATIRSVWALERLRPEHAAAPCAAREPIEVRVAAGAGWWPTWVAPDLVGAAIQRRLTAFLPLARYFTQRPTADWTDEVVPYAVLRPAAALEWVAGTARWTPTFGSQVRDLNFWYHAEKLQNSVLVMLEKALPYRAVGRCMDTMVVERARRDPQFAHVVRDLAQAALLGLEHDPATPPLIARDLPIADVPTAVLAVEAQLCQPDAGYAPASPRPNFRALVRLWDAVFAPLTRADAVDWNASLQDAYARERGRYKKGARKRQPKPPPAADPQHERLFHFVVEALPVAADARPTSKMWTYVTREFLLRLVAPQPHLRQAQRLAWDALEHATAGVVRTLRATLGAELGGPAVVVRPVQAASLALAVHCEMARAVKDFEQRAKLRIVRTPKHTFIQRLHSLLTRCLVKRRCHAMLVREHIEQVRDLIDPPRSDGGDPPPDLADARVLRRALPERELLTALLDHAWPGPTTLAAAGDPPAAWAACEADREAWTLWVAQRTSMAGASQPVFAYQATLAAVRKRTSALAKLIRQRRHSLSKPRLPSRDVGERWQRELGEYEVEIVANKAREAHLQAVLRAYLGARMGLTAPLPATQRVDRLAVTDLLPHVPGRDPQRTLAWTLARYAETQRRLLPTLEYEIPADEKTWVWRVMSGMDRPTDPRERAALYQQLSRWLIPLLPDSDPTDCDDGGAGALFQQLCARHEDAASDPKMLEIAERLPTLPQTRLAFAAQVRKLLDSVQLQPLPAPVQLQQVRAMRSVRYSLLPTEPMPARVWHVYLTFCCGRVVTYTSRSALGHRDVLYDVEHQRMTCGVRKRRAGGGDAAAGSSDPWADGVGDDDATDDESFTEDEDDEDADAAEDAAELLGEAADDDDEDEEEEEDANGDRTPPADPRPRGWRPPVPAGSKYRRFGDMPEKDQMKEARAAHVAANRIECGDSPPVMCLNLWGYRLLHGSGFERVRAYQHCPHCGRFHRHTEATATYGGYACEHCRRERAPPLLVERQCARCRKPVPNVPEEHARGVVFLDDPAAPYRVLWWCTDHRPWVSRRSTQGLFADTHELRLTKRRYRSLGLRVASMTASQRQFEARKRQRNRARYSARGQRDARSQWQ